MAYKVLLVASGGAIGSVFRFLLGAAVLHRFPAGSFPLATTVVNMLGCFLIGLAGGLAQHHHFFSPQWRLFLFTGILGGFTTLSAFGFESFILLQKRQVFHWALFASIHVFLSIALVWLGFRLVAR